MCLLWSTDKKSTERSFCKSIDKFVILTFIKKLNIHIKYIKYAIIRLIII